MIKSYCYKPKTEKYIYIYLTSVVYTYKIIILLYALQKCRPTAKCRCILNFTIYIPCVLRTVELYDGILQETLIVRF